MSAHVGVVGLGLMGTAHATRLREAGATVVGADVSAAAREEFASEFDAPTFESHEALLDSGVDAVVVTVPNSVHEAVTVDALERGVHVLVEKPLAHTVESAERIAAAARDSSAFCTAGFVMRYYGCATALLDRCAAGEFGEVQHVEAAYVRRDGVPESGWFRDAPLAGGGALVDIGVHVLDLALASIDFPAVEGVYGRARSEREPLSVEDSATALLRCADGSTISLEAAWASNRELRKEVVVRGTEGGATLDLVDETLTVYDDPTEEPTVVETGETVWLTPEVEAFVAAVDADQPPSTGTIDEALTVQRAIGAVYESSDTGEVVRP
ncbi:Gfo/Idh/MocA family protein [Haloarchaeobius sp. DFWS5]|uniref:Gfo/Idh/MocA family protein n=1 Tax=Haloarchaeobius sp. DFWS5 TaxID=3446114 RepID=UPI003EBF6F9C